ncbi:hypothetical protein F4810DRAFT_245027 [Camillea tinctor]|nr:hypothetical protein F4810DRAFT_245027 [Camillea tinctor]
MYPRYRGYLIVIILLPHSRLVDQLVSCQVGVYQCPTILFPRLPPTSIPTYPPSLFSRPRTTYTCIYISYLITCSINSGPRKELDN